MDFGYFAVVSSTSCLSFMALRHAFKMFRVVSQRPSLIGLELTDLWDLKTGELVVLFWLLKSSGFRVSSLTKLPSIFLLIFSVYTSLNNVKISYFFFRIAINLQYLSGKQSC